MRLATFTDPGSGEPRVGVVAGASSHGGAKAVSDALRLADGGSAK